MALSARDRRRRTSNTMSEPSGLSRIRDAMPFATLIGVELLDACPELVLGRNQNGDEPRWKGMGGELKRRYCGLRRLLAPNGSEPPRNSKNVSVRKRIGVNGSEQRRS
jgi:hypothetical protein